MFTAALLTTARTWNQPKYPPTDEWIKWMWYIRTTKYYSAKKGEKLGHLQTRGWNKSEVSQRKPNITY